MSESFTDVARDFAQALADENYERAASFLAPALSDLTGEAGLLRDMRNMVEVADDSRVTHVELMNTLDDWPARQPGDAGWAYVAMSGDGFSEAVAVVVSDCDGELKIREIEWGRP